MTRWIGPRAPWLWPGAVALAVCLLVASLAAPPRALAQNAPATPVAATPATPQPATSQTATPAHGQVPTKTATQATSPAKNPRAATPVEERIKEREALMAAFKALGPEDKALLLTSLRKQANADSDRATLAWTGFGFILLLLVVLGWLVFLQRNVLTLLVGAPTNEKAIQTLGGMPMGLPAGTVRSALAIVIVAVGLWLYVLGAWPDTGFKSPEALTGILGMVLGFYFGTRTGGGDELQEAAKQVVQSQQEVEKKAKEVTQAQGEAKEATQRAETAEREAYQAASTAEAAGVAKTTAAARPLLKVMAPLLEQLGPALIKAEFDAALVEDARKAQTTGCTALTAIETAGEAAPSPDVQKALSDARARLSGQDGACSLLGTLLATAAPVVGQDPALGGELAPIAALLAVGARLESDAYRRWSARMLAAPVANGLLEFGAFAATDMPAVLVKAPLLQEAFAPFRVDAEACKAFDDELLKTVQDDNAAGLIWSQYGPDGAATPVFRDRQKVEAGLLELQQAMLAIQAKLQNDIKPALVDEVAGQLGSAAQPAVRLTGGLKVEDVERMVDAVVQAGLSPGIAPKTQAALHALITLVGLARQAEAPLGPILAEVAS